MRHELQSSTELVTTGGQRWTDLAGVHWQHNTVSCYSCTMSHQIFVSFICSQSKMSIPDVVDGVVNLAQITVSKAPNDG